MKDHPLMRWAIANDNAKKLFDQKRFQEAIKLLEREENLPSELKVNLAKCYYYNRQSDKALETLISVIEKDGPTHDIIIDLSLYNNSLGHFDRAKKLLESLVWEDDPKVKFNLGWHYLREGKFKEGFDNIQYGKECRAWGNEYHFLEKNIINIEKRWDGKAKDCSLLYILEGGYGDQIIFLRWINYLKNKYNSTVTVACSRELMPLIINCDYECISYEEIKHYVYNYYVPAMSLPAIVNDILNPTQHVKFPYIKTYQNKFIKKLIEDTNSPIKIGIKWFGNPQFEHDQMRTLPKEDLISTVSKYGDIFSFQFEDNDDRLLNTKYLIKDWFDTYSVISSMDIIVTSCTSIAHLCGAMNKKCIVIVPLVSYFTWASDKLNWYESVTVIRQKKYNDWSESFNKLEKILRNYEE